MDLARQVAEIILTSLGLAILLVGGLVTWLGNVWEKRIIQNEKREIDQYLQLEKGKISAAIEKYKTGLEKSQFIFQKQYEAASELTSLYHKILPSHTNPEMDWSEACDEVALRFAENEISLKSFMSAHGAILDKQQEDLLAECIYICGSNKFIVSSGEVSEGANQAAEAVLDKLCSLRQIFQQHIFGQIAN